MTQHLIIFCLTLFRHRNTIFKIVDLYYGCQDSNGEKVALAMRAVSAVNSNGELDLAGMDRITESDKSYELVSGVWWLTSVSRLYATDNSAAPLTNSVTRRRLSGFTDTLTSDLRSLDINGNETITTITVDRDNKKVTQTVDVPDSISNAVNISVNGLLVSSQRSTLSAPTLYSYDALERRNIVTDARLGNSVTHYDSHGWIDYIEDAGGRRTSYSYDSSTGRKISQTDPLTNVTYYSYLTSGQLERTWGSAVYPVWYEYDIYGRMTKMHTYRYGENFGGGTWPQGVGGGDETLWTYQEHTGLLQFKRDAGWRFVEYRYGAGNRLSFRRWSRLSSSNNVIDTTYSYDPATADLTGIDYSDSTPDVSFTYDRIGRQKTANSSVSAHTFAYSGLNLVSETVSGGAGSPSTLTRQYDSLGRPMGFSLGSDYEVAYGFDSLGRFHSVSSSVESVSSVVNYYYLPDSDLLYQRTMDSGLQTTFSYEANRNLLTQVKNEANGSTLSQFDYLNDAAGRRVRRVDSEAITNTFGYNRRSEVTSAEMGTNQFGYQYDPIGNRKTSAADGETKQYTVNSVNQYILIANGETNTLAYDADGNLTNDSRFVYTWDAENRLIGVETLTNLPSPIKVENLYDHMSRRSRKVVGSTTNMFVYDSWNLIRETSYSDTPSLTYTNTYIWGLDLSGSLQGAGGIGGLVSVTRSTSSNTATYYPCYDANGNITDYVDTNGVVVAHREYDPFGRTIVATGPMVNDFHFWFSTKYLDHETGLYYYGYRFYSPSLGRWLSRDPIGEEGRLLCSYDSIDLQATLSSERGCRLISDAFTMDTKIRASDYTFAGNNPCNKYDLLGLINEPPDIMRCCPDSMKDWANYNSCFDRSCGKLKSCVLNGYRGCEKGCPSPLSLPGLLCVIACRASVRLGCNYDFSIDLYNCPGPACASPAESKKSSCPFEF